MDLELPGDLLDFLRDQSVAMLTVKSSLGAVLVVKIHSGDIESCRGRCPVHLQCEVFASPAGPVVRLLLSFYDRPWSPLVLETFFNPSDNEQMEDLADLFSRDHIRVLFFDQDMKHRMSKGVTVPPDNDIASTVIPQTRRLLYATDPRHINFDAAKLVIMAENPLIREE